MRRLVQFLVMSMAVSNLAFRGLAQRTPAGAKAGPSKVIFDTDIGDDIDDAYALELILHSPEVQVIGVTTAFRDTHLRARLATRFLAAAGHPEISVYEGPGTAEKENFSQTRWAEGSPDRKYPDAIAFILDAIRKSPGEITLLSLAPMTNVGALIARDPATFRKLKRVVLMGGSVERGYGMSPHPDPEWNILNDIPSAKALFQAGVPLFVMPLDSTQIPLNAERSAPIFAKKTGMAVALRELTEEWNSASPKHTTPRLYDAVAAAYAVHPEVCPTTSMRLEVDDKGYTRKVAGPPNAQVCLHSTPESFFDFFLPRVF